VADLKDKSMNIDDLITRAFSDDRISEPWLLNYLTEIRANWREAEKAITHSAALIVVLATAFELIAHNSVGEVTLGVVKVGGDLRNSLLSITEIPWVPGTMGGSSARLPHGLRHHLLVQKIGNRHSLIAVGTATAEADAAHE